MSHPWGSARLEFLALKAEIEKRIQTGRSVLSVYKELKQENRITMGSTAFYTHCRKCNFVVGSNINPETLQRSILTPEEEKQKRQKEELDEIIRERMAKIEAREQAQKDVIDG